MLIRLAHLIHEFDLLPRDVSAIFESHRAVGGHFGNVSEPNLEESDFDEDELVVLSEVAKAWYSFGEFDDPLDRGGDSCSELLPEPNSLRLDSFSGGGSSLGIFGTCGLLWQAISFELNNHGRKYLLIPNLMQLENHYYSTICGICLKKKIKEQTHGYYHGFSDNSPGRFFRESAVCVMSLRDLKYNVINGQLFAVCIGLIRLDNGGWWNSGYHILTLTIIIVVVVIIVVIRVAVVVVVDVIIVVIRTGVVVVVVVCGGCELLHSSTNGGCRRRYVVLGPSFPRAFRHTPISYR